MGRALARLAFLSHKARPAAVDERWTDNAALNKDDIRYVKWPLTLARGSAILYRDFDTKSTSHPRIPLAAYSRGVTYV